MHIMLNDKDHRFFIQVYTELKGGFPALKLEIGSTFIEKYRIREANHLGVFTLL